MMKSEYRALTEEFRTRMLAELEKPEEDQELPGDDKWLFIDTLATCRTPGCPVEGKTMRLELAEPIDGVYRVLCGRCHITVEDLDPMLEDDEDFRLNVRLPNGNFGVTGDTGD